MKTDKAHEVPISSGMLDILKEAKEKIDSTDLSKSTENFLLYEISVLNKLSFKIIFSVMHFQRDTF